MPIAPTGHEMATIRRDAARLLRQQVQVWRPTNSRTTQGGTSQSYALASSGPGELAPMNTQALEVFAEKLGLAQGWIVTHEHDRDVRTAAQLRIDRRIYEVISDDRGRSGAWLQRVPCREVTA